MKNDNKTTDKMPDHLKNVPLECDAIARRKREKEDMEAFKANSPQGFLYDIPCD